MTTTRPHWITGLTWLMQIAIASLLLQLLLLPGSNAALALPVLITAGLLLLPARFLSRIDAECACSAREVRGWTDWSAWVGYANVFGAFTAFALIGSMITARLLVAESIDLTTAGIAAMATAVIGLRRSEANAMFHAVVNVAGLKPRAISAA